ncbi:protein-tyrosine phosphatase-like protein [Aspergillus coremiiformis]|uniref:Protein-tyrosine phosphatase-like protein n=1 Tax=Aspergillus coremiiformis TaxID=138285 RepID=A0A5N6YUL5_9EURO|nr:protein-tyrosine phosphatase-like protein [Aspergillus coremiiformis]
MLTSYVFLATLCLFHVQAMVVEPRSPKPAFLSLDEKRLRDDYGKLKKGNPDLPNKQFDDEYNDELYWDGKFGTTASFWRQYPFDVLKDGVDTAENEYSDAHPHFSASRLPGLGGTGGNGDYIACRSPVKEGRSQKFMYWDMIWNLGKDDIILVDLVNYHGDALTEGQADLIPSATKKTLTFLPPTDRKTKKVISPYSGQYVVQYQDIQKAWPDKDLEYRKVRLEQQSGAQGRPGSRPRNLHYFHLTGWKNRQPVDMEKLQFLIDQVDQKLPSGSKPPLVVNCLLGKGRTGTFIEAREIYHATVKAKNTKWFLSSADPIADYTLRLRQIRSFMLDSASQFVFLHTGWAARMWTQTAGGGPANPQAGPASSPGPASPGPKQPSPDRRPSSPIP